MATRTNLYVMCLILFPLAFSACVVGFGCPVWLATSAVNEGLWQTCSSVFVNCSRMDFDAGGEWMIGVRIVEIFALVMLTIAAADILYENCCTDFHGRHLSERLAPGILCILGGLGGITGIVVYVVKNKELPSGTSYGWALALMAAGSGLSGLLGIGFCVSGGYLEYKKLQGKNKGAVNGRLPHLTSNNENYQLSAFTNSAMAHGERGNIQPDNLPGFALYNGVLDRPGNRNSLPLGNGPYNVSGRGGVGGQQPKGSQYYSLSDDRVLDPNFDLSEGFSYQSRGGRQPTSRSEDFGRESYGGRAEDPYNRGANRPPRAGYNDPYGFDRQPGGGVGNGGGLGGGSAGQYARANSGRANEASRNSFYRPGRF